MEEWKEYELGELITLILVELQIRVINLIGEVTFLG